MKEEKVILPSAVLVSLYKDSLVLPEMEIKSKENEASQMNAKIGQAALASASTNEKINVQKAVTPDAPLKYLGDHLKKIIVLVKDETAVHLNETDLGLLSSILNACKLTLADIALLNVAQQSFGMHEILETLPSSLIISFQVSSKDLKIKLPTTLYQPFTLGETRILFSDSLTSMQGANQAAKNEKAKLWNALKMLFQL